MLLVLDNYLEIGDWDEYKKDRIKFVVNNRKIYIVILIYWIL